MLGWFLDQVATIEAVAYPRDAGGGEVPTPAAIAVQVPCCVQQDAAAAPSGEGQARRGSTAGVTLFLAPSTPPESDAVAGLKVNDRVEVAGPIGPARTLVLDGPPHDASGRGAVWEARARDVR